MVSQDLEAVIHAEGEHVAVVGGHRVVKPAVGTVGVGVLGRKSQRISQQQLDAGRSIEGQVRRITVAAGAQAAVSLEIRFTPQFRLARCVSFSVLFTPKRHVSLE